MGTIKIKFRASTKEGKEGRIYFQIIHKRVVKNYNTKYKVFDQEWDAENGSFIPPISDMARHLFLTTCQHHLNEDYERFKECINKLEYKDAAFTTDDIIRLYHNTTKGTTLVTFMKSTIEQLRKQGRARTSEAYDSTLSSFNKFTNHSDIYLEDINQDLMKNYEQFLKNNHLSMNSISFYMRILRAVYNKAVEKELTTQRYPFRHVYTGIDKTAKRAIPKKQIKAIKEMNLPTRSNLDFARDMFLFSFFTRGMSFVDMAYLKKKDLKNSIISYRRKKTGQPLSIRWEKCMQDILNKYPENPTEYLLPIITRYDKDARKQYRNSLTLVNRKLKVLSSQIRISFPLSMYVARHSWASIAKSENIPLSVISEGMGHESEKTTRIYLSTLDTSIIDRANRLVIKDI